MTTVNNSSYKNLYENNLLKFSNQNSLMKNQNLDERINSNLMINKMLSNSFQSTKAYNDNDYKLLKIKQNNNLFKLRDDLIDQHPFSVQTDQEEQKNIEYKDTRYNSPITFLNFNQMKGYRNNPVSGEFDINISNKLLMKDRVMKEPIKDIRVNNRTLSSCFNCSQKDMEINNFLEYDKNIYLRKGNQHLLSANLSSKPEQLNNTLIMILIDGKKVASHPYSGKITNKPFPVSIGYSTENDGSEYSPDGKYIYFCSFLCSVLTIILY